MTVHLLHETIQRIHERRKLERLVDEAVALMNEINKEGFRAGYAGKNRSENPYCKGWHRLVIPDTASQQWDSGWVIGWKKRKDEGNHE